MTNKHYKRILLPICYFMGHIEVPAPDKPGWFLSRCGRCNKEIPYTWFRRIKGIPHEIAYNLVWLANQIDKLQNNYPGYNYPKYRAINQHIEGMGTKHSCGAYSYEHIMSLLKQYEDDGLPEPLLSTLISEDGWIDLEEHPEMAQEVIDSLNKGVTLLQTKEEQEELNRYED